MVDINNFKKGVIEILNQKEILFEGKNFEKIINIISEVQEEKIFNWLKRVKNKEEKELLIHLNLKYKNWKLSELLTFRYAFSINNIEYRILVVKVKNENFIEFHLGNHKYYDKKTGELFLKKSTKFMVFESAEKLNYPK